MANKQEEIGTANLAKDPKDSRVDLAWEAAKKWLRPLEIGAVSTPDFGKIIEAMTKAKKPMSFVARFDGKWLEIGWQVGSTIAKSTAIDISSGGDVTKWRSAMLRMKANTRLVNDEDLKKFEKEHPNPALIKPADPQEVAKLEQKIGVSETIIKSEEDVKNWYAKKYADFDWQQRRLDFLPWAKKQGFEAYAQFMVGVTDGFQDYAVMKTHVLRGANLPIKLQPATRAAMEAAFAANKAVDYTAAKAEVLKIVDGSLMPKFRAVRFKEAEKTVATEKKNVARLRAELAKLKGRK